MADHIGGIAVLDLNEKRPHLYCLGIRDGKPAVFISIPIRLRGTPETSYTWQYDIQGDEVHVTPSVRQMGGPNGAERFHNTADWKVKFKMFKKNAYKELKKLNPNIPWE
jgi:hypothetical protein